MDSMKDLLSRVRSPGAFSGWRHPVTEATQTEAQVWPELARVAQGIESYAQELKQYVAEGNREGVSMALEAMLKHQAELLSAVVSDEAAEHCLAAAYKTGGSGL